ncbi:amino-acid permease [Fusarium pseudocircinatum]|uniref:Amino-acid permease n=1 Tax=Fusarium pseudocircinatum TaxID=56676 RepID=A0A8H5PKA4_9HYPO|nr:amino-acid permease [Fusarium pseudocircinatum]
MNDQYSSSASLLKGRRENYGILEPSIRDGETTTGTVEDLGYHASYRRIFEGLGSFALVLSVASPVCGIAIGSSYQIVYGGYWGLTWGWIIPAVLFFAQPLAIAELCSSMPVNGANYWWTAALSPMSFSRPLSFISGWITIMQIVTSLASVSFACGTSLVTIISVFHPEWHPSNSQVMGIAMSIVIFWGVTSFLRMESIAWICILSCSTVLLSTVIYTMALPITHSLRGLPFAPAAKVFGEYKNSSDWGQAVAVPMTFFSTAWAVAGWNAPSYVVEETKNARVVGPRSIVQTYLAMAILGMIVCIVSAFCIEDIESATLDPRGLPLYTLVFEHFGHKLGAGFFFMTTSTTVLGGSSFLLTSACQVAAFARDGGLPFSKTLAHVHEKTNMPIYSQAVLATGTLFVLLFGLSSMAGTIIFSLSVIANLLMLAHPILLRIFAQDRFVPGPFNLGKFSKPIHIWAFLTLVYMMILESFPPTKHWTAETFNYNWVVTLGALVFAVIGWFSLGHKYPGLDMTALDAWREHHARQSDSETVTD